MPIQLTHTDLNSAPQKLSKIETLRLARNYIIAMSQTLQEGQPMEVTRFVKILSNELSQTTANILSASLLNRTTNYSYRPFNPDEYEFRSSENVGQDYQGYRTHYMTYGENYGQFCDHGNRNFGYDNSNNSNFIKHFNGVSRSWEYNNNVAIGNNYPYGGYQYVAWQ